MRKEVLCRFPLAIFTLITIRIKVTYTKSNQFSQFIGANETALGKISAQPHTIVKQIFFPNGNLLFLSLFSQSKN